MSIPNAGQRKIRPTHPGTMLREDFLPDYGLTVSGLSEALGGSRVCSATRPSSGSTRSVQSICGMRLGPSSRRSSASSR